MLLGEQAQQVLFELPCQFDAQKVFGYPYFITDEAIYQGIE